MRIKVDEDLPRLAAQWLRDRGYEASTVRDQEMSGWEDSDLWEAVQSEQRFLVTADKGFGDLRVYTPGTHGGVLLLRPAEDGIRPILELLQLTLKRIDLTELQGSVTVVTPRGLRIRRK
jgi:predicted nuclease of predicted toxin-antitoxin system